MGQFVADPQTLRVKGMAIENQAEEFAKNIKQIYSIINEMITSNYLDPAARAIATDIETYHTDMDRMAAIIKSYADFCIRASRKVINNQDEIISRL